MVLHEGDLMERKRIPKGELAILRLVAGQTVLKLATEKIYEHLIDHVSCSAVVSFSIFRLLNCPSPLFSQLSVTSNVGFNCPSQFSVS